MSEASRREEESWFCGEVLGIIMFIVIGGMAFLVGLP